ncbi:nucleoside hydrolase-like domain-containing protein [Monashia sp. NPDC004114]
MTTSSSRPHSPHRRLRRIVAAAAAVGSATAVAASTVVAGAATATADPTSQVGLSAKHRTVVTTDMEQDDLASLIRYMFYTNDLDTEGIIYTASRFHWAGDGAGTPFFLPGREYKTPQTSWRWTGNQTIQDQVIPAYAQVYPNLKRQDSQYPSPTDLLGMVKIGNVDFEGEMDHDTPGSDLIKNLLLDNDPRQLYLQAWGGTNTIARALKSIQDQYSSSPSWSAIQSKVNDKAVILASGFQDQTYADYIAKAWPSVKVEQLSAGYATWGYNCARGTGGNVRGLPEDRVYFSGAWIKQNIQIGALGSLYRSWLDGQAMPGDQLDIFGIPALAPGGWCKPLAPYDFLSEGDNVSYMPLLDTGIDVPSDPTLGGWGGRATQTTTSPNLWTMVGSELDATGKSVSNLTTLRWAAAAQNDFANRIQWSLGSVQRPDANHAPKVSILAHNSTTVHPGESVSLRGLAVDPDQDALSLRWWQYREEGTYPGAVSVDDATAASTTVTIPADAQPGQTLSFIFQATDDGQFPLTRYARVVLTVG